MTPLIEKAVSALAGYEGDWDPRTVGTATPQSMLAVISAAKVFVVDEAETDTTCARDLLPAYFASTAGFYLPAPVCWYEYKAYAPGPTGPVASGLRSAFLALADETGGIAVFAAVEPFGGFAIFPAFGFEKRMERCSDVMEGREFRLRVPARGDDLEKVSVAANFFLELVELVNMPTGVVKVDEQPERGFRRRLASAMGRIDFQLQPVTHVTIDEGDLRSRAVRGVA
jgi:hypothetical protein